MDWEKPIGHNCQSGALDGRRAPAPWMKCPNGLQTDGTRICDDRRARTLSADLSRWQYELAGDVRPPASADSFRHPQVLSAGSSAVGSREADRLGFSSKPISL